MKPNGHSSSNGRGLVPCDSPLQGVEPRTVAALPDMEYAPAREYISLSYYWNILCKRRWTLITTMLVLVILVAIGSLRMTPIYRATARVQVEADNSPIQSLNDLYQKQTTDDAFLQTQIQVLKSDSLAWQTIEQLGLARRSGFVVPGVMEKQNGEEKKVFLISLFRKRLSVELVPRTRMLVIGFESPEPRLAALVSTTLVSNYMDYNFRLKYDATRQASGWMEQQLDELKAKVEKSQQELVDYERQHAMADINSRDRQNVEEQMLSDLSRDLTTARADRIQKQSLYNQVRADRQRTAFLAHNELLQKLEEKAADLQGQYREALSQYGPKFPKALRLGEQVEENRAQIERERDRVLERVHNDYVTALNREELAGSAIANQKEQLGNLNQLLVQHNILQREFEANQQLYQNLMQRLKDATVSAGLRSTNIHLVDAALPPNTPVRPRILLNIAIGLLAGIVLGVLFALAQEALDHSVKTAEDVESTIGLPSLGVIPLQQTARHRVYGLPALYHRNPAPTTTQEDVALLVANRPASAFAEAYRALRTAILLSLPDQPPRTLLVTSSAAGEGKTVSSLNLATALAQRKGPVLVIDADMRKSGISRVYKRESKAGLSTVLSGSHTLEQAMQQSPELPDMWVLPAGPVPPSPADLLSSDRMAELMQQVSGRFEHIVIDSPPVLAVTDATILSRIVDGVVLVAQSGETSVVAVQRTRRTLENAGARILGVVLNKFDHRQRGYSYSYYHYGHYSNHYYSHGS